MREYIGARYVPKLAVPYNWDSGTVYEPLTIVGYNGSSYTSRTTVPAGITPTNEEYWALTGNYNGQVENYRQEVAELKEAVDEIPSASFNDGILNLGYPTTGDIDVYNVDAILFGNKQLDIRQTNHAIPEARVTYTCSKQAEFEAALDKLNNGECSVYIRLTGGSYTMKIGSSVPVFSNCSLHISSNESVVLDVYGSIFYNVHLNIQGNIDLVDTSESAGRIEGSSATFSNINIECNLRFRSGGAIFTGCTFIYTTLLTVGTFVDSLGATISFRNCSFTGVFPDNFSLFGCGDGARFLFTSNITLDPTANAVYMFLSRDGTWYNEVYNLGTWINSATNEKFDGSHIAGLRMRASGLRLLIHSFSANFRFVFDENYRSFPGTIDYDGTVTLDPMP